MCGENLTLDTRINNLRSQLDCLGYHYEFSADSIPLLEVLVADLLQTTDTLRHYKILSQNTLQTCRDLEIYADSYKQENERLNTELKRLQSTDVGVDFNEDSVNAKCMSNSISDTRKRLEKENQNLRERCSTLAEDICDKENNLQNCKQEVKKLRNIVQNKFTDRPILKTVNQNSYCCGNEMTVLRKQNIDFRNKLEKALLGQQEAKHNAMKISEKYTALEKLHKSCKNLAGRTETFQMHVQSDEKMRKLEEEVSKLKEHCDKLDKKGLNDAVNYQRAEKPASEDFKYVQEILDLKSSCRQLEKSKNEIENELYEMKKLYENIKSTNVELERDLLEQRRLCQEKEADKDKLKKRLSRNVDEVKMSLNRINELKIIERDLTLEIGRLNNIIALQKRHIIDLEEKIKESFSIREKKPVVPGLTISKKPIDNRFKSRKPELIKKTDKCKPTNIRNTKTITYSADNDSTSSKTEADQFISNISSKYEREIKNLEIKPVSERVAEIVTNNGKYENAENNNDLIREKNRLLLQIETYKQEMQFLNDKVLELNQKNENLISTINQKNAEFEKNLLENRMATERIPTSSNVEGHSSRCVYCSKMEKALTECDSRVCKLEIERTELLAKQRELNATVECNNRHIRQLRTEITNLESELHKEKSDGSTYKSLYEQSKVDSESNANSKHQLEVELNMASNKVVELERDRDILRKQICVLESEHRRLEKNMTDTASRKELLLTTVDKNTERLVSLEKLLETRELYVKKLEQSLHDTQRKLDLCKSGNVKNEEIIRKMSRDIDRLKSRLKDTEKNYENVTAENKRLQSDLTALSQDYALCRNDSEKLNKEASDLRIQIHEYIEKVRAAQETLREKDSERAEMLEHFRSLTREAKQLENNNHSLESEAHSTKTSLQSAESKIYELEHTLQNKDSLLVGYEQQISALTQNIAHLEITVKDITEEKKQLEVDLTSCRELCNQMDNHRDTLSHSVSSLTDTRQKLEDKCNKLEHKVSYLEEQLSHGKIKVATLERRLQETETDHKDCSRIISELREEIKGLHATIKCLEESLERNNNILHTYQTENTEYHRRNIELNRHLLNSNSETIPGRRYDYVDRNTL